MSGNIWITFLCEGPRHAPSPSLGGGGGRGRREPLPWDHRLLPPLSPPASPHLPGLSLDGLSLQPSSTPALLTPHTSPFCGAAASVCFSPCHIYDKRRLLSALTLSSCVPPHSWVIPCLLLQRLQLSFPNSVLIIK